MRVTIAPLLAAAPERMVASVTLHADDGLEAALLAYLARLAESGRLEHLLAVDAHQQGDDREAVEPGDSRHYRPPGSVDR